MVIEDLKRGDVFKVKAAIRMIQSEAKFLFLENMKDKKRCRAEATFHEIGVTFPHGTEVEKV